MLTPLRRYALMTAVLLIAATVSFFVIGARLVAGAPADVPETVAGLPVEAVSFTGSRDATLRGWLVATPEPVAAVLLMHGLGEDRRAMLERARFLYRAGYAALLFDFQGHGASDGEGTSLGFFESYDAAAAVELLNQRYPSLAVIAVGRSLGGAASLLAEPPLDVDGLVVESVWPSLEALIAGRLKMRFGTAGDLLTGPFVAQTQWRLGIDAAQLRPIAFAADVTAPTLLMSGSEDPTATSRQSLLLFAQLPHGDSVWLVGRAAQHDLHAFARDDYEARVLDFIAEVVAGEAAGQTGTPGPRSTQ